MARLRFALVGSELELDAGERDMAVVHVTIR